MGGPARWSSRSIEAGGVLGRPLKVIYEDTKGQPAEGSAAAVRLITRDNVAAIVRRIPFSSVALAEIDIAHKNSVAWVGTDVWADKVTAQQYPEVFRLSPANSLVYVKVTRVDGRPGLQACRDRRREHRFRPGRRQGRLRHPQARRESTRSSSRSISTSRTSRRRFCA